MTTLDTIRTILVAECGVDPQEVGPTTHLIDELGIDSLDLLNAAHRIERDLGITIPMEQWLREEYGEVAPVESPFVLSSICQYVDKGTGDESS